MSKIAAEAAHEIALKAFVELPDFSGYRFDESVAASIVQSALSQSCAERDKEIESLAARLGLMAVALNRTEPEGAGLIAEIARELAALTKGKAI